MKKIRLGIHAFLLATCLLLFTAGSSFGGEFNWRKYEGTTLRVLAGKSGFTPIIKKHVTQFEELTGITVNAEYYPTAPMRKKLVMELGAKNKDLDMFPGMMKTTYQYDQAGWLEPLDKYINNPELTHPDYDFADFVPRTNPVIDGRLIGITNSCNPQLLMYRKDLFEQYGIKVPTNWAELEAAAETLKAKLPKGQFAWIVRMNKENTAPFATFLYTNGGSWLDADGKPAFNRPEAVEALEFYGKMAREYGPPGASGLGWKEVVGAMAQGKAAMTVEVSIFANLMLENPKRSRVAGKMGYALVPPGKTGKYETMIGLNTYHISAFSQKKEAAWFLLHYLTMKQQLLPFKMVGLPSTRMSINQHPKVKAKDKLPQLSKLQVEALHNGRIGFEIPIARFTEARPILQRVIYTGYEGGDVQKAADVAAKEIERLIE
ncbi:MAG: sugar ABC transporter substrate-binding protein [Deltaproteobacteria bacterium]|nr:sugar ABC transporter substrate-binding protein [Deltaproteobacteria bacterium]